MQRPVCCVSYDYTCRRVARLGFKVQLCLLGYCFSILQKVFID